MTRVISPKKIEDSWLNKKYEEIRWWEMRKNTIYCKSSQIACKLPKFFKNLNTQKSQKSQKLHKNAKNVERHENGWRDIEKKFWLVRFCEKKHNFKVSVLKRRPDHDLLPECWTQKHGFYCLSKIDMVWDLRFELA